MFRAAIKVRRRRTSVSNVRTISLTAQLVTGVESAGLIPSHHLGPPDGVFDPARFLVGQPSSAA
jgi:hypothetical protein